MFDLTGKVIVVTGAGGGLGKPIALALAGCGADVAVTSRDQAHLEPVVKEVEALGRKALAISADVTSPESTQAMVDKVMAKFGKIDVAVNVAGTNTRFSAEEIAPDEFERVIRFNVLGTFNVCQAVGKVMIAQGYGKLVNMSSVRGRVAPDMGGSAFATSIAASGVALSRPHQETGAGNRASARELRPRLRAYLRGAPPSRAPARVSVRVSGAGAGK